MAKNRILTLEEKYPHLIPNSKVVFNPSESIYLDFEFNNVTSEYVNLVSCATVVEGEKPKSFWLHKDKKAQAYLADYLKEFKTVVGYACVAEARSMMALGLNLFDFNCVDLFYEYRMLTNHNDAMAYGKQLVDGKVRHTVKPVPKWMKEAYDFDENESDGDEKTGFKPTHSLAEATYKLLSTDTNPVIRDTKHKEFVRDLIISAPLLFTEEEQRTILDYGNDDVIYLPRIRQAIRAKVMGLLRAKPELQKLYDSEALIRGRYAFYTAEMEQGGYPIDYENTKNFSMQVGNILYDVQREINTNFPEVKPFVWNKQEGRFSAVEQVQRDWIQDYLSKNKLDGWMTTDKGKLSLKVDAWSKFFPFKHEYPKDNFGAQMLRYLKIKKELYGFVPTKDSSRKKFWDFVGPDQMVRPYLNPFGAQSSRSQPQSSGFMFLKPAWMRALVQPKPGWAIGAIDWKSQEFFLSALTSKDENMINSYLTGDPYLAFGKLAKMIPKEGTKETHPMERDACKSTVLGISYLMTKYGLAIKLTQDTGRVWSEEEAEQFIDMFYEVYEELQEKQQEIIEDYEDDGFIRLPDGWYMWGDNENARSVTNVPIQGLGAAIMRAAVDMARRRGLKVIFTLHDAIYITFKVGQEKELSILAECMREATGLYFQGRYRDLAIKIGLDPVAWSPDYPEQGQIIVDGLKIPVMNRYLDKRSKIEYDQFSKYFFYKDEFDL